VTLHESRAKRKPEFEGDDQTVMEAASFDRRKRY
jgi:hypothetical protein